MRRRSVLLLGVVLLNILAATVFAPVSKPDDRLDRHLASEAALIAKTHDVFDNNRSESPSRSPYGPIQSFEVRRLERRNLIEVMRGLSTAIAVLRTDRGLVVERVSSSDLDLERFASLTHTELGPDDVPSGVLSAAERRQHRVEYRARGAVARSYTTGGYDG